MNQQHFDNWGEMAKKMQEPFRSLTELNVRTLQNFNYLKPDEWAQVKKPEEMLEKQVKVLVENAHKSLDYLQESFLIIEKAMLSMIQEAKQTVEKKQPSKVS